MSLLVCLTGAYSPGPIRAVSFCRCMSAQKSCRHIMQHMVYVMQWAFVWL